MKPNMGGADRVIRAVVGVAVIAAGFYFKSWWGAIGLIPLGTAIIRWCPAYLPFGFSTRGTSEGENNS
jgi:type IV secretory pathway TrbD component